MMMNEIYWTKQNFRQRLQIKWIARVDILDLSTVKPRFTVPRFTGSLDLPGLNSIPRKQAFCVNQCKMHPNIPRFSIYRA